MNGDYLFTDTPFAHFTRRSFLGVLLTGIVAGIIALLLTSAIDKVVLQPAMCQGSGVGNCVQSAQLSYHIASIIAGLVALVMLVQASVYRPLLVVLAVTVSFWNLFDAYIHTVAWPLQLLSLVILNVLAYFAFTWILRVYNFTVALVATFVLALLVLLVSSI